MVRRQCLASQEGAYGPVAACAQSNTCPVTPEQGPKAAVAEAELAQARKAAAQAVAERDTHARQARGLQCHLGIVYALK